MCHRVLAIELKVTFLEKYIHPTFLFSKSRFKVGIFDHYNRTIMVKGGSVLFISLNTERFLLTVMYTRASSTIMEAYEEF